jgi:hypothetical protein
MRVICVNNQRGKLSLSIGTAYEVIGESFIIDRGRKIYTYHIKDDRGMILSFDSMLFKSIKAIRIDKLNEILKYNK